MVPGAVEVLIQVTLSLTSRPLVVGRNNLSSGRSSRILIKEEVAGGLTLVILHLQSVGRDHGVHESIVSLLNEVCRHRSFVAAASFSSVKVGHEVLKLLTIELEKSPVVMQVAREGAIWVSVLWLRPSNVGLGILLILELSEGPVIVQVAGECGIWVRILWLWASDVGLGILLILELSQSPIVMKMRGESAIRMSVLGLWASDVRLRVLIAIDLSQSPVIVEMRGES